MWRGRLGWGGELAAAVLLVVAGIGLLVVRVTAVALGTTDTTLGRSADQVTVLGGALTIIGLACSVGRWAWRQLRGGPVSSIGPAATLQTGCCPRGGDQVERCWVG